MNSNLISMMILIPFLGAIAQFISSLNANVHRWIALTASVVAGLLGVFLVLSMEGTGKGLEGAQKISWIASYSISYSVGLDGLNILLLLLVSLIFPILIVFEWDRKDGVRGLFGLVLFTQACLTGLVCAQDLFLIFFFWTISTIPIFFMISIWGEGEQNEKPGSYYAISSAISNGLFFISIVLIYYSVSPYTFNLQELSDRGIGPFALNFYGFEIQISYLAFLFLSLAVAIRTPVVPFHGWLTYSSTRVPISVLVILTGVSIPVTLYVFAKISFVLFPSELRQYEMVLIAIGLINVIYAALSALAQRELRLFLAFLSLSQVGVLLIGFGSQRAEGVVGAVFQQLSLGVGLAGFGMFVGIIRNRTGDFYIAKEGKKVLGGLVRKSPVLALISALFVCSIIGIPGLGGFIGQSLIMMGSYTVGTEVLLAFGVSLLLLSLGLFGVYSSVFLGDSNQEIEDLSGREKGYLIPMVAFLLLLGLFPRPLIELVRPSIEFLLGGAV